MNDSLYISELQDSREGKKTTVEKGESVDRVLFGSINPMNFLPNGGFQSIEVML